MDPETRHLDLAGGQRLALVEYGTPEGEPLIFCHGWPGMRRQASRLHEAAKELGFRVFSFDRPGIGESTRPVKRRLLDWPPLIAEAADRLGIGTFKILGVSGGGPYALATGWALPDRVRAAAIVCGAPPIAELPDRTQLMPAYRALLALYARSPEGVRWLFRGMRPFVGVPLPRRYWPLVSKVIGGPDGAALADPEIFENCYETFRGAWTGGADGVFDDARLYAEPWGFAPEEIHVPVHVWHGRGDANFAWQLADGLGARIPQAQVHIIDDEGHYSLPFRQGRPILAALREA